MSLRKRCRFRIVIMTVVIMTVVIMTIGSMIAAFAAAGAAGSRANDLNFLRANARPDVRVIGGEMPTGFLLPVQIKNARHLGLGKVLVASRDLGDPHFAKTVILLIQYDARGVVGLILNRRTDVALSKVLVDVKGAKGRTDTVYLGGPMEPEGVFALFESPGKVDGAEHIFGATYLIRAKDLFEQTILTRPDPGVFHVYMGYAGWTEEQLRKEVELGAWYIFPADAGTIFNTDPESLWPQMIGKTELRMAGLQDGKSGGEGGIR